MSHALLNFPAPCETHALDDATLAQNHYRLEALLRTLTPQQIAHWIVEREADAERRVNGAVADDRLADDEDTVHVREWKAQAADATRERDEMAAALRRVLVTKGSPEARRIAAEALQTEAVTA